MMIDIDSLIINFEGTLCVFQTGPNWPSKQSHVCLSHASQFELFQQLHISQKKKANMRLEDESTVGFACVPLPNRISGYMISERSPIPHTFQ